MKSTNVNSTGQVTCPNCGATGSFRAKRTPKAKVIGILTLGIGALVMPRRLNCDGCGAYLKRGGK